jgi:hypothetical protein
LRHEKKMGLKARWTKAWRYFILLAYSAKKEVALTVGKVSMSPHTRLYSSG